MQMKKSSAINLNESIPGGRVGQSLNNPLHVKTSAIPIPSVNGPKKILFRSATQSVDEAVMVSDASGNIVFWDEGAERLFGYVEKEILGRPMALLMSAGHISRNTQFDHMLFNKTSLGDGKAHELRGIRKDGREFPMELSLLTWKFGCQPFFTTIMRDITERKRLQKEILEISRREQQRIGQDIHDGICQDLTAVTLLTKILEKKLLEKSLKEAGDVEEITKFIVKTLVKTKLIAKGLLPVRFESQGLMAALQELAFKTQRLSQVSCLMRSTKPVIVLNNTVAVHLYRIAQEAVHNALKHAKADHIIISLSKVNREIVLSVEDDGVGIEYDSAHKGLGLSIMNSRAETINATLQISKHSGGGTVLICSVRVLSFSKCNI